MMIMLLEKWYKQKHCNIVVQQTCNYVYNFLSRDGRILENMQTHINDTIQVTCLTMKIYLIC